MWTGYQRPTVPERDWHTSSPRNQDRDCTRDDAHFEVGRRMVVTVDLDRLERFGFDRHLADGAADHTAAEFAGPQHQGSGTLERLERAGPAEDDQLEPAIGRIDRLARADPTGHQLSGVRHEHEVADDLDRLAVSDDPEVRWLESCELADRGADVCSEFEPSLPFVLCRRHHPRVETHPAGGSEQPFLGSAFTGRTVGGLPPACPPEVQAPRLARPDDVESRFDASDVEGTCEDVPRPNGDDRDRDLATEQRCSDLAH